MSIEPERIILPDLTPMFAAVGHGLTLFATVELGVGFCFASMLEPAERHRSIAAFNGCRSFDAKLMVIEALAPYALNDEQLAYWKLLCGRVRKRKRTRDKLAHWMVSYWPGAATAEAARKQRAALVPPIWRRDWAEVMWLPNHERRVQPLFLERLEGFHTLVTRLGTDLLTFSSDIKPKSA